MPLEHHHAGTPAQLRLKAVLADAEFRGLKGAGPDTVDAYVEAHAATLPDARRLIKLILNLVLDMVPD